jgi:glyoxylase-like metal-dependent hydrolase (beta-lactamase superfamily II)
MTMAHAGSAPLSTLEVGDIKLTWIPDGIHHVRALEHYENSGTEFWQQQSQYIDDDDWLVMSVGSLLIQSGETNALLDLGFGPRAVEDIAALSGGSHHGDLYGGEMLKSLAAAGLQPADINAVILSHLHPDHIGWAGIEQGDGSWGPTFANADYYVGDIEWDYWNNGPEAGTPRAPSPTELATIGSRLKLISGAETILPGITAMPTYGHTPGHISFVLSSGKDRAVVLGDAIHCPAEIVEPELEFVFDVDPELAGAAKRQLIAEMEKPDTHVVGGHFPNSVFGRVLPGESRSVSFV